MSAARVQRLELAGELTIQTAAERKAELLSALAGTGTIEIRLAGVTELDTAGVQLLLLARREAAKYGRRLLLRDASPAVTDVLAIAHLTGLLADPPAARPAAARPAAARPAAARRGRTRAKEVAR